VLLRDMSEWAKNLLGATVNNSLTENAITDFVVRHKQYVRASLATCRASDALKKALVQDFANILETRVLQKLGERFGLEGWSFAARISESGFRDDDAGILLRRNTWPEGCLIGIETYAKRLCFGVKWPHAPAQLKAQLNHALNEANMGSSTGSDVWPWCPYVRDFGGLNVDCKWYESETLEAMHDEWQSAEIIKYFVNLIVAVADVVVRELN
jgi:hypothetical protein